METMDGFKPGIRSLTRWGAALQDRGCGVSARVCRMIPRILCVLASGFLMTGLPGTECVAQGEVLREVSATVHPDLPAVRLVLQGSVDGATATIERIDVYFGPKTEPAQVIAVGGATAPDVGGAGFILEDMNFDGYADFRVQAFVPAGPNTPYLYWLYDPASGGFKPNRTLEEIASPTFHPAERVIRSENRSSAASWVTRSYHYVDGVPRLFREKETRIDPDEGVQEVRVRELKDGVWVEHAEQRMSLWTPFSLPSVLRVEQQVVNPPEGWIVQRKSLPHRVTRITVFDGRPEQKVSLRYHRMDSKEGRTIAIWKLDPAGSPEGYWISAHFASTDAVLSRPLPRGITRLRTISNPNQRIEGFEVIERVEVQ